MKYRANASEPFQELCIKALDSMVIGSIIQFIGTTIPTGWLECNGATITQSDYPELYNLIGGTLPDFRGRVLVGQDTNDTDFDTLLETGGSKELQEHSHTTMYSDQTINVQAGSSATCPKNYPTKETGKTGTGNSGNLQPYAVVKHIIKAKNTTPTMASIVNATNNSTTDGYSCDYVNKLHTYSTDEIRVGTWIDGKPIYRIVIQFTTTSTTGSWQSRALGISNLEKIIKYDYTYETNSTEMYNDSNYVSSGYNLTTRMNKTDGLFNYLQNGYKNADITLIVEYTKTTD